MRLRNALSLLGLLLPIVAFGGEIEKIDSNDYNSNMSALNSTCASKGSFSFSGFCISKDYGRVSPNNPTQASITLGIELATFEFFYSNCKHSGIPSVPETLAKTKNVLDTKLFYDEVKDQNEAVANFAGHFYYCKTQEENDSAILSKQKYFDYMAKKYSTESNGSNPAPTKFLTSNKSAKEVVGCILAHYRSDTKAFFADGVFAKDGSIVVSLYTATEQPLAAVKSSDSGSVTQYINTQNEKYAGIPQPELLNSAIVECQ